MTLEEQQWALEPKEKTPRYWTPTEPYDWATGGRQLSEEERAIARRLAQEPKA